MIAYVVMLLGTLWASYYYMFKPRSERIADIRNQTQQKARETHDAAQGAAGVQDLPAEIDKLRKAISFFEGNCPRKRRWTRCCGKFGRSPRRTA